MYYFIYKIFIDVILDKRLTFISHVAKTVKQETRIRNSPYPILNKSSLIPLINKVEMFNTYVVQVCSARGYFISKSNWKRLESIQNISLRTITVSPSFVQNSTICNTVGQDILNEFIHRNSKFLFHKISRSRIQHIRSLGHANADLLNDRNTDPHGHII